jgi:hypothetical protein
MAVCNVLSQKSFFLFFEEMYGRDSMGGFLTGNRPRLHSRLALFFLFLFKNKFFLFYFSGGEEEEKREILFCFLVFSLFAMEILKFLIFPGFL